MSQVNDGGKVTKDAKNLVAINPVSQIEWEFDLAPGAERTIPYQYKVLMHR